jgi:hypothetical protein
MKKHEKINKVLQQTLKDIQGQITQAQQVYREQEQNRYPVDIEGRALSTLYAAEQAIMLGIALTEKDYRLARAIGGKMTMYRNAALTFTD